MCGFIFFAIDKLYDNFKYATFFEGISFQTIVYESLNYPSAAFSLISTTFDL